MYLSAPLLLPTRRLRLPNTIYVLGPKTRFHQQEHSRSIKHPNIIVEHSLGPHRIRRRLWAWCLAGGRGGETSKYVTHDQTSGLMGSVQAAQASGQSAGLRRLLKMQHCIPCRPWAQEMCWNYVLPQGRVTSYGFLDEVMLQILQVQWLNRLRNFAQQRLFTIISPRNSALQPNGHNRSQKCKFGQAILDVPRKVRLPTHQGPCILNIEGLFFDPASSTIAIVTVGV